MFVTLTPRPVIQKSGGKPGNEASTGLYLALFNILFVN